MIGFLNIYKPSGMTSNAVVQKIKKKFNLSKIGHMGTLDPMACGLLPVAVGKATRLFNYMLEKTKSYLAVFDFGYETDTLDITGVTEKMSDNIPSESDIRNEILKMTGKYNQIPPKFSAKNINGSRAYDLARNGIDFELKSKEIEIFKFELVEKISSSRYKFFITCSSGTYIRAIGRDLAKTLDTYATMSFLERCEVGVFVLSNSVKLDELLNSNNLNDYILSPVQVLPKFGVINIDIDKSKDLENGKQIEHYKIDKNSFVICDGKILGIANPNNNYLKLNTFLKE